MYDISPYHLVLAALGLVIILAYWLPRLVSRNEPAASALLIGLGFLVFGLIPGMPDAVDPIAMPKPWEVISELCVVAGLFGVGLRIDRLSSRALWTPTIRLLVVAMPLCILAMAVAGWAIAGMTLVGALLLAAVRAPTDPVLAGDVQVGPPLEGGEHPVRFALTTEAGLNDGLAFPFVHLALALAAAGGVTAAVITHWLWLDVAYRVLIGAASGALLGWIIGKFLFDWPRSRPLADTQAGVIALAGVLAVYGLTELIEGYGFVAAFVSGLVLRRKESAHAFHAQLHDFTEAIEHALTALLLIALGAALPALFPALTLAGAGIGAALIFIIRPLSGWLSLLGTMDRARERHVIAFYGVRGVGSIYYLAYAGAHAELTNEAELWAIVAFTILLSTIVHGFTSGAAVERATEDRRDECGSTAN